MLFDRVIKAQIFISNQTGIMPKKCDNNLFAFSAIVIKNVSKNICFVLIITRHSFHTQEFSIFLYIVHINILHKTMTHTS